MMKRMLIKLLLMVGVVLMSVPAMVAAGSFNMEGLQLAAANRQCPSGMTVCQKGSYGPGGCYKMGYASCTSGLVCSSGMRACAPGQYGKGGCYKPVYANCYSGLTCSSGMQVCAKSGKNPYCYKPNYGRCE